MESISPKINSVPELKSNFFVSTTKVFTDFLWWILDDEKYIENKWYEILEKDLQNYILRKDGKYYFWKGRHFMNKDLWFVSIDWKTNFDNIYSDLDNNSNNPLYIFCDWNNKILYNKDKQETIKISKQYKSKPTTKNEGLYKFQWVEFFTDEETWTIVIKITVDNKDYIYDTSENPKNALLEFDWKVAFDKISVHKDKDTWRLTFITTLWKDTKAHYYDFTNGIFEDEKEEEIN